MTTNLEALSHFAFSMATCLASGLGPVKSLELSGAAARTTALRKAAAAAADACSQGLPVSDGFELSAPVFPRFFIPVIRAGEMGGRHVEAFQLVHDHCQRLKPSRRVVRNTWLYPLVCILAGWMIRTGILLYFGMYRFAVLFVRDTFVTAAGVGLIGWVLLKTRPVKEITDYLSFQLPLVRETLLRQSVVLFFATFRLAYETGGVSVITVFDLALATVRNSAIRKDLALARPVFEDNGTFQDAFNEPALLDDTIKSALATGALSGHLGASLEQIVKNETLALELTLDKFNWIYQRLVAYGVVMSVVGTLLFCLSYSPK